VSRVAPEILRGTLVCLNLLALARALLRWSLSVNKSEDGVDLISDRFRYGPIWYAGPDAVRNAVAYAKYCSLARSRQAKIRVLDDFGAVIHTH
jgi:hypothetical protein